MEVTFQQANSPRDQGLPLCTPEENRRRSEDRHLAHVIQRYEPKADDGCDGGCCACCRDLINVDRLARI